jgi:putative endonuclease
MYYLYILECVDATLYTGITTDLDRRIEEHNTSNRAAKYTRSRRPVRLIYSKRFRTRSKASQEEARIKKFSREQKLRFVKNGKI